jgi:hypothetical protein
VANRAREGGVLLPDNLDTKTNEPVIDLLRSKHPEARIPDVTILEKYENNLAELDITKKPLNR